MFNAPPPSLPSRQVSWASSPHQLLVLRLYVPLESHIIRFLCWIHDNGDNNPTSGHERDVCSAWPEANNDILLLLNNVNILKRSNNVNIVPGDPISAHQYQCLLVWWWPPWCVVIMSYHMTHVMFTVISLRCVTYQADILPSRWNMYPRNWQIEFKEKFSWSLFSALGVVCIRDRSWAR